MEIQIQQIIFQIINFGIVAFVLAKFLYQPIRKILDQRAEKIESGLKAADENLKKQNELEETIEAELKKARQQAEQIIAEAKKEAEETSQAIIKDAKADAKGQLEKERQAFEAAIEKEKKEFMQNAADLVRDLTQTVLQDSLSAADQRKIVDHQIQKTLKGVSLVN